MRRSYRVVLASAVIALAAFSSSASAKCMSLTVKQPDGSTANIIAVAPDSGSVDLDAAGYKDASCGSLDKVAYLEKVCNPKTWGNSGMQRQFAIQAGISLAQLCSAARTDASLPDLTPVEMAQRFLPPTPSASATTAKGNMSSVPATKTPLVGRLGTAGINTAQTGGQ